MQKEESEMTKEEWGQYFSSHWNFNGVKQMGHMEHYKDDESMRNDCEGHRLPNCLRNCRN